MEQHNQEIGTRRDLVLYRLETARLAHPVIHCRDWNAMFLTPCFASLPTGLKFMDSFRPQCDFFIFFHNDTVSFLCYEKSVSEKYGC